MTDSRPAGAGRAGRGRTRGAGANDLLRWTDENFGGDYVVASNMQDAVLVDLAAKVRPGVDVLFLDTGYHFVETIGTRDAVEAVYDINVVNVTPENTSPSRTSCSARTCSPASPTNAAGCARSSRWARRCGLLRVGDRHPPRRGADARQRAADQLGQGVRTGEDQPASPRGPTRTCRTTSTPTTCWSIPLCSRATRRSVARRARRSPIEGADPRSGRWAGTSKTECGLHAS